MANKEFDFDMKKVLQFLVDSNIVPEDVLPSDEISVDNFSIIKAINEGCELRYDEFEDILYYIDDKGAEFICPDLSEGISNSVNWISDYLPEVFLDMDQGGNVRKADEAESCYKLFSIGVTIPSFKEEISEYIKDYNFDIMSFDVSSKHVSFKQILQEFQNLNSIRINSIISAAAYKISLYKEKNASYYIGLLDSVEILKLNTLSREIKSVISKYEITKGLNVTDMKSLSKISKLRLIDERDVEIEKLINSSSVSTLYRICKLNSERIPPFIKSVIIKEAEKAGREAVIQFSLKGIEADDFEDRVRRDVIREANRAVLKTIKYKDIQRFKANPLEFKFKLKS